MEGLTRSTTLADQTSCWEEIGSVIDTAARLPQLPFLAPHGYIAVGQFDHLLGSSITPVFAALAEKHGDDYVTVAVIDPEPFYYQESYSHFPSLRVAAHALDTTTYWAGISYEPGGDPTGAIAFTGNVVAAVGSTQSWSVWAERRWELLLLQTKVPDGDWLRAGIPFPRADEAVQDLMGSPSHQVHPDAAITELLENLRAFGAATSKSD